MCKKTPSTGPPVLLRSLSPRTSSKAGFGAQPPSPRIHSALEAAKPLSQKSSRSPPPTPPAEALLPDVPPPASCSHFLLSALLLMHATHHPQPPSSGLLLRGRLFSSNLLSALQAVEPSGFTTPRPPVWTHRAGPEVEGPGEEPENPGRGRSSSCNKPAAVATPLAALAESAPRAGAVTSLPRAYHVVPLGKCSFHAASSPICPAPPGSCRLFPGLVLRPHHEHRTA